ncbi:MAG: DUF5615 family PIN-like protein [Cyclobacteriaceae bacterium]|nr:DUF5615 family PIN-like protein [Cyclobacteriaceae bacterium]
MQFLCDVHISIKVAKRISKLGYKAEHINSILDKWHTKDKDIANYVDKHNLILITKDQDFRNSYLLNHSPKKLLKINLGNISNKEMLQIVENHLNQIELIEQSNSSFMIEINKTGIWVLTK